MNEKQTSYSLTRRSALWAAGALVLSGNGLLFSQAWASPEVEKALEGLIGSKRPEVSPRLKLHLPEYAYDGSRVPFSVEVEYPMTESDYVRQVHVLSERNPFPRIATFHFTPRSGRAFARTRIRLAMSQNVIVVAELSDGSVLTTSKWIEVTLNGCKED